MTTFDKREEAFEKKFAHDEELQFKATAKRNKKVAAWAVEKMGKGDAESYFKTLMAADFEEKGDEDVIRRLTADFAAAGAKVTDAEIRAKMGEALAQAVEEIKTGK